MKNIWSKTKGYVLCHKVISVIILIIIIFAGYEIYGHFTSTSGQIRYVISAVQTGTIVSAVSGSGQVSASSQVDVQAKASGDITSVNVVAGQTVGAGALIAEIDSRSADISLENAKVALAKLTEPTDSLTLLQDKNTLQDAKDAQTKAYIDGFNDVDSAFLDLPKIMAGLNTLFNSSASSYYFSDSNLISNPTARNYRQLAFGSYDRANSAYNKNLIDQRNINRNSATSSIESLIEETYQTAKLTAQALKDTNNAVSFVINQATTPSTVMTNDLNNINSWTNQITVDTANLNSVDSTISGSDRTIANANEALTKLITGPDTLDIRAQQLAVNQAELSYSNYFVRAPFGGVIAKVDVHPADTVGNGTAVVTLITNKKIANITLNEVDAAKVKVGQKATLTFDAIDGLSVAGEVSEIDLVGTVTQGVVNYNVKVAFDTQDPRVLSGMSVNVSIATDVKQNVVLVPNSSIKTQNNISYVQMLDQSLPVTGSQGIISVVAPTAKPIQIGVADDTNTEIVSGLKVSDKIITKTISSASAKTATSQTPSLFGNIGGNRGGGAVRPGGAGASRGG